MQKHIPVEDVHVYRVGSVAEIRAHAGKPVSQEHPILSTAEFMVESYGGIKRIDEINAARIAEALNPPRKVAGSLRELVGLAAATPMREALGLS